MNEDDRPSRRQRSRRDEEFTENDLRPMGKNRGRGKVIALFAVAVLALVVAIGAGVYVVIFRDSGSAEGKARPPRQLQMDMFAYTLTPVHGVVYADFELMRELGDPTGDKLLESLVPKESGITAGQVLTCCSAKDAPTADVETRLIVFRANQDLRAIAARCKLQPHPNEQLAGMYVGRIGGVEWNVFQPNPTKLVFIPSKIGISANQAKLAELLARDPGTSKLPDRVREGLMDVSGYPRIDIYADSQLTANITMSQFSGTFVNGQRVKEWYSFQHYSSPGAAKGTFEGANRKLNESQKKPEGELENGKWLRGDRIYFFQRTQLKE
jgi:hypothetical protein